MISFYVPAIPIAQPRQRVAVVGGHARAYMPGKHPVSDYKATVRLCASQAYRGAPLESPIGLSVVFVMPRPASKRWKSKPMPRYPHTGKPDVDNLVKSFCDALNGLVWRDDSQVWKCCVEKFVAGGGEQPGVYVEIRDF